LYCIEVTFIAEPLTLAVMNDVSLETGGLTPLPPPVSIGEESFLLQDRTQTNMRR